MQHRSISRRDPRYKQLRTRNNDSVKKSREKSRRERTETIESINQLEQDNQQLIDNLKILKNEYKQLQNLFKQHTGKDIEELLSTESKINSDSSNPTLTINTIEDESSLNNKIDSNNLDGSIVLINGIQYKIVSIDKN